MLSTALEFALSQMFGHLRNAPSTSNFLNDQEAMRYTRQYFEGRTRTCSIFVLWYPIGRNIMDKSGHLAHNLFSMSLHLRIKTLPETKKDGCYYH